MAQSINQVGCGSPPIKQIGNRCPLHSVAKVSLTYLFRQMFPLELRQVLHGPEIKVMI